MRIVIPILGFSATGGGRVLSQLATQWTEAGHTVHFIANTRSDAPYHPTSASILWIDDAGREVKSNLPRKSDGPFVVAAVLRSLTKAITRHGKYADVVLANHSLTAWPVFLARVKAKKLYYVQAYEPEFYAGRKGIRGLVLRALSASSYLLPLTRIVNSPLYLNYKLLRSRECVPFGIDLSLMKPRHELHIPTWGKRTIVVGAIGRREVYKGTPEVLAAVTLLLKRGLDVELHLAYGNYSSEPDLGHRLRIVIPKNDNELAEYYRSTDVIVAAGRIQLGAGHYPVLEAMACGVPVVTTGYLPASQERNNAWFVPINSPKAIADAIESVFADPQDTERRVRRALEDVIPFSWQRVAHQMMKLMASNAT